MKTILLVTTVAAFVAACSATTPLPKGTDDPSHADHPANPAVQSQLPTVGALLKETGGVPQDPSDPYRPSAKGTASPNPHAHQASPPATGHRVAIYVCPMHPEITATGPGDCPKCGMHLVESNKP